MASSSSSRGRGLFRDIAAGSEHIDAPAERMGLLSLTLAPGPGIKWILPARIRSRRRNDVVFVGSTYIQLREFQSNGQLADATAKIDFGVQIIGAKVISAKSEMIPTRDAILDQEVDEERFIIKGKPCTDEQPPQIVVLITATSDLVYLYARETHRGKHVEFVYAKRALLGGVSALERHLRHIAIDPDFKMMAAASYNTCTVWSLKEVDEIKESIDAWNPQEPQSFQPNIEQRLIQVDGHILKMEFLRPSEEEPDKVILLFIVANGSDSLILLYRWDTKEPLDQIQPMSGVLQTLPRDDRLPLLLIPSQRRRSFVIVTETNVIFYDDIQSPNARRMAVLLPSDERRPHPRLWVQWAKPSRHDRYSNKKEDILLIREDGHLRMFTRPHNPPTIAATNFSPGVINMDVDAAVCMLPGPRGMGGDTLIVGGSMSDGGVFHLPPRQELLTLQIIPNFSPVHDVVALESVTGKQKQSRSRRTFVTTGKSGESSLNELRFGHEAQVGWTIPVPDGESINQLWALENTRTRKLYILASHLEHTSGICLDLQSEDLEEMDSTIYPGLVLDMPTLTTGMLQADISVQINSNQICAAFETATPIVHHIKNCISAGIDRQSGMFAIACKTETDYQIKVGLVREIDDQVTISLSTTEYACYERPLCLSLFTLRSKHFLSAGYSSGCIAIFLINTEGQLTLEHKWTPESSNICPITSVAVLVSSNHQPLLLAGTRTGELHVLKVVGAQQELSVIDLKYDRCYQIGSTQVSVIDEEQSEDKPLGALIHCGSSLDRIVSLSNDYDVDYMLMSVWLSTRNDLTYANPVLCSVQRVQHLRSINGGVPSGFLICATRDELLLARLVEQEQTVPRRLKLGEKGAHLMIYSKYLSKFVVANDPLDSLSIQTNTEDKVDQMARYPTLHVVDPDRIPDDSEQKMCAVLGDENEHVKVLMAWEPTDGKTHYNLIMVGLSSHAHSRLGFLSVARLVPGTSNAVFKTLMRFTNKQIHAACAVDHSSLAVSVGREIVLMRLDVSTRKWHEDARFTLPSPGLSVSAQGTVLYIATQSHSTIVLVWRKEIKKFEKLLTDRVARNTRSVTPFGKSGDHLLVTTAWDGGTSILGYSIRKNALNTSTPLFEAQIPLGVNRITHVVSNWVQQPQYAFQGLALDGTIFRFQTLSYNEWKLLRFLELLVHPDPLKPAKKQMSLLTEKMAQNFINAAKAERIGYFNPKKMHIHGDVLKDLIDAGVESLNNLLHTRIKTEDGTNVDEERTPLSKLETLAKPVIGETSDLPAAIIIWVRKLLRATLF